MLQLIAKIISNKMRPHDIAARYGGEEFAILLRETDLDMVMEIAEQLRLAVANHNFATIECRQTVTISIGVAVFPTFGNNRDELFARADKALTQAKNNGRNCVVIR